MRGAVMVCGTTSDAGKSTLVTGLCRLLARRGVRVAPFKAQNMANNSWVTRSGHEIGRAQAVQALAAGIEPEVGMNPVLLKPTSTRTSQLVVMGRPAGHLEAAAYQERKAQLFSVVAGALRDLRDRYDVVVLEGAGSPAEINLLEHDIVNLRLAAAAGVPALVVGDIDRGGVFAALYGTVAVLPEELRRSVKAFVLNRFRGDPALLGGGLADLEARCGVPTLGVLPWVRHAGLDTEDSLALRDWRSDPADPDALDVAVVAWPTISNFTDLDALRVEPGVGVRLVTSTGAVGDPDLLVLPGSKATVADLTWLRERRLDDAVRRCLARGTTVLGICGGYQALGRSIDDTVETGAGTVAGLGLLGADTVFAPDKVTLRRSGRALGRPVDGYQIHHGRTTADACGWVHLDGDGSPEGAIAGDGAVLGTSLHGLFDSDTFRDTFLAGVARRRGRPWAGSRVSFAAARAAQWDALADLVEEHLDTTALDRIIASGAPS